MENIDDIYKKYANVIKNYIFSITENESLSEEIKEQYKMNYDNMSVDVTIWKKLYNMSIKKESEI